MIMHSPSPEATDKKGKIYILSGPGGVGKTTIAEALHERLPWLERIPTVTTRTPRGKEIEGEDYYFVDEATFQEKINADELIEHVKVYGRDWYGTPRSEVESALSAGKELLLVIDVEGALEIKKRFPAAVLMFLMPPTIEELRRRLQQRGHDSEAAIADRLKTAINEIAVARVNYDYTVLNDDLDAAISEVENIIATH